MPASVSMESPALTKDDLVGVVNHIKNKRPSDTGISYDDWRKLRFLARHFESAAPCCLDWAKRTVARHLD